MYNTTDSPMALPPLPAYTLRPLPPLVPGLPDAYLSIIALIAVYWAFSMLFHIIDVYDLFPQYRLHTPAEVLKRNHVSRFEVVKDVLIQQAVQAGFGVMLAFIEPEPLTGKDDYNVAVWAQRIRLTQRAIPKVLAVMGVDAKALAQKAVMYSPSIASALSGGLHSTTVETAAVPSFAEWELITAKLIYWLAIPALQFALGILIVDTWQYFLHRAMHMNKWLYTTFHSRHHRLYVPYAYGALYNHPFEGFLLDTCGAGLAYLLSGMTTRQGICFFVGSTLKTVDDHCGYAFPWDPLQHITSNNAGYHDVHHQSWGIKTNFSQPFFTFWDRWLGTAWTGGDVSARYERARLAAEKKVQQDQERNLTSIKPITASNPIDSILADSNSPYTSTSAALANSATPRAPPGKATTQAAESRSQVLDDSSPAGGVSVLLEETAEEEREVQKISIETTPSAQSQALRFLRRSPRKRLQPTDGTSLIGLGERVAGGARARHAARGKVLGYESSM